MDRRQAMRAIAVSIATGAWLTRSSLDVAAWASETPAATKGGGAKKPAKAAARIAVPGGHEIRPRAEWGADRPAKTAVEDERVHEVRFFLVHHTVTTNSYSKSDVPGMIRNIFDYHTGDRHWPDVAYNFFVDRHGGIWEGRTGSLAHPVRGSATGGSQSYSQLCAFLGDHSRRAPTREAVGAMHGLLAWLGARYGIDTSPGAKTHFPASDSSRWSDGTKVSVHTIAAHRDVGLTACPGDAAYELVDGFQSAVTALRTGRGSSKKKRATKGK